MRRGKQGAKTRPALLNLPLPLQNHSERDLADPAAGLDVYLVGGAVRDRLLGRPVSDRDWVVAGATADDMLARRFKRVGHDFPVFLHPHTGEQYALARRERKTAPGHQGFITQSSPDVTLEEDLLRRDLTINALAEAPDGQIIDPYGGLHDIQQRRLRHVSPAFAEDPLRVLRVARFAAQLHAFGFEVAAQTMVLMREMAQNGEVDTLVAERVQQELAGALNGAKAARFVQVLRDCGALSRVLPEIEALFNGDNASAGEPLLCALDQAYDLKIGVEACFAVLAHDFAGAPGNAAAERAQGLCARLRAPRSWRRLALLVARWHDQYAALANLSAEQLLALIEHLNGFREPALAAEFCQACTALSGGYAQAAAQNERLLGALAAAQQVDAGAIAKNTQRRADVAPKRINGLIQAAINQARCDAIRRYLADNCSARSG